MRGPYSTDSRQAAYSRGRSKRPTNLNGRNYPSSVSLAAKRTGSSRSEECKIFGGLVEMEQFTLNYLGGQIRKRATVLVTAKNRIGGGNVKNAIKQLQAISIQKNHSLCRRAYSGGRTWLPPIYLGAFESIKGHFQNRNCGNPTSASALLAPKHGANPGPELVHCRIAPCWQEFSSC